ncbi:MAG: glycosyltransferase [Candidatus Omnitrophica bacterium]|nr:glycosyltransferase [Candidatus Omnitrophota bacterium]
MSVIVPAYNREDVIEQCLRGIRSSAYKDYELIVVDCASTDRTFPIAKLYADAVIQLYGRAERARARSRGVEVSKGQLIVNVDSDVVIKPDTLEIINLYFSRHQDIDALTGCLSKENPYQDFFSQYKSLYMHYHFIKLPERVNFLYGSIYAIRRVAWRDCGSYAGIADDTALGQQLILSGRKIAFLKELQVTHLKKYSLLPFIKNDFIIPFEWAKIFLQYRGFRQLGRDKTGFAHASKEQLLSVILAPSIFIFLLVSFFSHYFNLAALCLIFIWYLLNARFIKFLAQEKGFAFGSGAVFITFLDNIIMASGIVCGLLDTLALRRLFKERNACL